MQIYKNLKQNKLTYQIEIELSKTDILAACQSKILGMFADNSGYFNSCTVWDVCNLLKIEYMQDTEVGKFINLFHCVDFADIAPEQIEKLKRICYGLVGMQLPTPKAQTEINLAAFSSAVKSAGFTIGEVETEYHDFEIVPSQY